MELLSIYISYTLKSDTIFSSLKRLTYFPENSFFILSVNQIAQVGSDCGQQYLWVEWQGLPNYLTKTVKIKVLKNISAKWFQSKRIKWRKICCKGKLFLPSLKEDCNYAEFGRKRDFNIFCTFPACCNLSLMKNPRVFELYPNKLLSSNLNFLKLHYTKRIIFSNTEMFSYLLNGAAFLKTFSTSSRVPLATSATVMKPALYRALAHCAFRKDIRTRSQSSL